MMVVSKILAGMAALSLAFPALADEESSLLDERDFVVSDRAFDSEITLVQFAGGIKFKCPAFEGWLERNQIFGARVALNDSRVPKFLKEEVPLGGIDVPGQVDIAVFGSDEKPFPAINRQENLAGQSFAPQLKSREGGDSKVDHFGKLRISDLAYCLLHEEYGLQPISYRNSIAVRNARIQELLLLLVDPSRPQKKE